MISWKAFFLTVVSFCLLSVNVYADSRKSCPMFGFYSDDHRGVLNDETAISYMDTFKIEFKKGTLTKIISYSLDQGAIEDHFLQNVNRALQKNIFKTNEDISQPLIHIFKADNRQYWKVKTTNSKKFLEIRWL